jgi:hypothetical protein
MSEKYPELYLEYSDPAAGEEFVTCVMQRVRRQQRIRTLILALAGGIGAVFGLVGAVMLADRISSVFTFDMASVSGLPVGFVVCGTLLFLFLTLNDDSPVLG